MKPLISIVMAVYNGEKYLEEQIKSILAQTYENIELIISDDVSTDGGMRIVEDIARTDNRVKIHRNSKNLGVTRNFLEALRFARGESVCFSDQDDFWRVEKLDILVQLIGEDPRNSLAYSDLEICNEDLSVMHPSFWASSGIKPRKGLTGELALLRNIAPGCSMMFQKAVADAMRRFSFPQPFMHDHLALVMASALGRIVYTRKPLVKYRQHGNNQIGAFYESVVTHDKIIAKLRDEARAIEAAQLNLGALNLEKVLFFCDCLKNGGLFRRLSFLDHYLFLRNNRSVDMLLGLWECLWPATYQGLRNMGIKGNIIIWLKRFVFLGWAMTVLGCFALQFVMVKLNVFRPWIK